MPWTNEKNIYKIWISEVILQQTRVDQGLSYYKNFLENFPNIKALATAADEAVFKVWEGLGYYSRCKNLIFTARQIYYDMNEKFPHTYEGILKLKGIGPYTAAAIASFGFGLPHAVLDGNVYRVLARFYEEYTPIDSTKGKQIFAAMANSMMYENDPAAYNQAIMNFGATVCKPQMPHCQQCILQNDCKAYNNGMVNKLPVKAKQLIKRKRYFTYFIFAINGQLLINKRTGKDIWENLYEFYLYESAKPLKWGNADIKKWMKDQLGINEYIIEFVSARYTQQLTHQSLEGRFIIAALQNLPHSLQHFIAIPAGELKAIPFPKFINQFIDYNMEHVKFHLQK